MTTQLEYLASEETPIGLVCLRRRRPLSMPGTVITEITLDHQFLMNNLNTASEDALAGVALDMHDGEGLQVLVGGLGLGHTARAVLASDRVARVEVVEFLEPVRRWLAEGLLPLSEALNGEPRCEVSQGDVYARLWAPPSRPFDLVLIDVDHSPDEPLGEQSARFYGDEGMRRAGRHLAPGGVLAVWSYAESPPFCETMERVFGNLRVEPVSFHNPLFEEDETNWLFLVRAAGTDL